MTEILLFGTFHFQESRFDFYTKETQNELKKLIKSILKFSPDVIAVEWAVSQQAAIDESYAKLSLSDFDDFEKMKKTTLGNIRMFGDMIPIRYTNETVQVAYRLGKELGLERIYGIDEDMGMDGTLLMNPSSQVKHAIQSMQDFNQGHDDSIMEQYRFLNTDEWSRKNQNMYMALNAVNTDSQYNGSMTVLSWYERNLKIFSNIQRLAENAKRIFIIYGAGHLQILRDFINETEGLKLANIYDYISCNNLSDSNIETF